MNDNKNKIVFRVIPKSVPGLSAYEEWKLRTSQPDATWEDYQASLTGPTGSVGIVHFWVEEGELKYAAPADSKLSFSINEAGELEYSFTS